MKAIVPAWRANSLANNWFNEFDQIFENLFDARVENRLSPACDIEESEKFILFSFDLPGLDEKDIHIELEGSVLVVSGERKQEIVDENSRSYRGRHFGRFQQSFKLPQTIDLENIEADYSKGVLKVLLPKQAKESPKKIDVKAKKGNFLSQLLKAKETEIK